MKSPNQRLLCVLIAGLLAGLSALPGSAIASKIYKWIDEQGNTVYSQTPPPRGVQSERLNEAPPPPVDPKKAMSDLQQRSDAFSKRRDDRLEVQSKGEEAAAQAKQQREICEQLRTNLANLQSANQVRVKDDKGELAVIGEEQRQQKIKDTQARIQKECTGN